MYLMSFSATATRWLSVGLLVMGLSGFASAHEFWIEPTQFKVAENSTLEAYLRNGENYKGSSVAYIKARTARFDIVTEERTTPAAARSGDNPALKTQALQAGLNIVVHQSAASVISYAEWEKFQRFADHKDFSDMLARHRARGLPETNFREAYTRYSKSLVAVGEGRGRDVITGLEIELVALQNPYVDDVSDGLRVAGYYQGEIRANVQIELFEKNQRGEVSVTLHRTDDQGVVVLPVKSSHSYLVDMVVLREPSDQLTRQKKVVWETLWASLTFAVP